MLIKILGGIDIFAAVVLFFNHSGDFPEKMLLYLGFVLLIKSSFGFFRDFGSCIDLFCGLIILLSIILVVPSFLLVIGGILIIQKGVISFL